MGIGRTSGITVTIGRVGTKARISRSLIAHRSVPRTRGMTLREVPGKRPIVHCNIVLKCTLRSVRGKS